MAEKGKKDDNGAEGGEKKKGLPKIVILGGAGAVLLLVLGGAAWFFLFSGSPPKDAAAASGAHGESAPKKDEPGKTEAFYLDLPELLVNLVALDNRAAFVKVSVSLQVPEKAMMEEITPQLPKVLDAFQLYLRELRMTDLQGSSGMFRLKEELQRRINLIVYPAKVDDVLFRSILVQ